MLLALLMCYAGFTALCLSTDRHHGELLHSRPTPRRRLGLRVAEIGRASCRERVSSPV